tara:strand:+ start:256 stop:705 length:450 start_codon:yes stop_codon:yes gene_type:complete
MAAIVMRIAVDGRIPVSNPIQGFEKGKPMLINISAAAMVPKMMRVVNERSPPKRIKRRKQAMMGIKMIFSANRKGNIIRRKSRMSIANARRIFTKLEKISKMNPMSPIARTRRMKRVITVRRGCCLKSVAKRFEDVIDDASSCRTTMFI